MENSIHFQFINEDQSFDLDYDQPNLTELVRFIIQNALSVSQENLRIECSVDGFDCDEFRNILIEVNDEFKDELQQFYKNIKTEINTYYEDEKLADAVISHILTNPSDN